MIYCGKHSVIKRLDPLSSIHYVYLINTTQTSFEELLMFKNSGALARILNFNSSTRSRYRNSALNLGLESRSRIEVSIGGRICVSFVPVVDIFFIFATKANCFCRRWFSTTRFGNLVLWRWKKLTDVSIGKRWSWKKLMLQVTLHIIFVFAPYLDYINHCKKKIGSIFRLPLMCLSCLISSTIISENYYYYGNYLIWRL